MHHFSVLLDKVQFPWLYLEYCRKCSVMALKFIQLLPYNGFSSFLTSFVFVFIIKGVLSLEFPLILCDMSRCLTFPCCCSCQRRFSCVSVSLGGPEHWQASPRTCSVLGMLHGSGIYLGNAQDERKAHRCDEGFWRMMIILAASMRTMSLGVLYMFNQVTGKPSDRWGC